MITDPSDDVTLRKIAAIVQKNWKKGLPLTLKIDPNLNEYCGKISGNVISAGSYAQLLDTAGRFLRDPSQKDAEIVSCKKISAIYFCTHFNNYYAAAPLEEIFDYIDRLALWGMNVLMVWFDLHHYRNMEDGKQESDRLIKIIQHTKSIGLKVAMDLISNEAFRDSPKELRADWTCGHDGYIHPLNDHYHVEICPSKGGGMERILEYRKQMLEVFQTVSPDYVFIMAYDQGGCTCTACAPWGCNGHLRTCEAIIPLIRQYFPKAEIIMSLWQFGTFTGNTVEFEGLVKAFGEGRLPEVRYLMAEPQYAVYPFQHPMPRPVVGFPEISMFRAWPWGGYGANPMPRLISELWAKYGGKLDGGFPYSEGIYTDINNIIMLRLYRENQPPETTIREYLSCEFGLSGTFLEQTARAVWDMEDTLERNAEKETHRYVILHPEKAQEIEDVILQADQSLSPNQRSARLWKLIYYRARIDAELVRNHFYRNEKVTEYFNRLILLSHLEHSGPYTKPDIAKGVFTVQDWEKEL